MHARRPMTHKSETKTMAFRVENDWCSDSHKKYKAEKNSLTSQISQSDIKIK